MLLLVVVVYVMFDARFVLVCCWLWFVFVLLGWFCGFDCCYLFNSVVIVWYYSSFIS